MNRAGRGSGAAAGLAGPPEGAGWPGARRALERGRRAGALRDRVGAPGTRGRSPPARRPDSLPLPGLPTPAPPTIRASVVTACAHLAFRTEPWRRKRGRVRDQTSFLLNESQLRGPPGGPPGGGAPAPAAAQPPGRATLDGVRRGGASVKVDRIPVSEALPALWPTPQTHPADRPRRTRPGPGPLRGVARPDVVPGAARVAAAGARDAVPGAGQRGQPALSAGDPGGHRRGARAGPTPPAPTGWPSGWALVSLVFAAATALRHVLFAVAGERVVARLRDRLYRSHRRAGGRLLRRPPHGRADQPAGLRHRRPAERGQQQRLARPPPRRPGPRRAHLPVLHGAAADRADAGGAAGRCCWRGALRAPHPALRPRRAGRAGGGGRDRRGDHRRPAHGALLRRREGARPTATAGPSSGSSAWRAGACTRAPPSWG